MVTPGYNCTYKGEMGYMLVALIEVGPNQYDAVISKRGNFHLRKHDFTVDADDIAQYSEWPQYRECGGCRSEAQQLGFTAL